MERPHNTLHVYEKLQIQCELRIIEYGYGYTVRVLILVEYIPVYGTSTVRVYCTRTIQVVPYSYGTRSDCTFTQYNAVLCWYCTSTQYNKYSTRMMIQYFMSIEYDDDLTNATLDCEMCLDGL